MAGYRTRPRRRHLRDRQSRRSLSGAPIRLCPGSEAAAGHCSRTVGGARVACRPVSCQAVEKFGSVRRSAAGPRLGRRRGGARSGGSPRRLALRNLPCLPGTVEVRHGRPGLWTNLPRLPRTVFQQPDMRFPSAIGWLRSAVDEGPKAREVFEALYRPVEVDPAPGLRDEAGRAAAILGGNLPASPGDAAAAALTSGLPTAEEGRCRSHDQCTDARPLSCTDNECFRCMPGRQFSPPRRRARAGRCSGPEAPCPVNARRVRPCVEHVLQFATNGSCNSPRAALRSAIACGREGASLRPARAQNLALPDRAAALVSGCTIRRVPASPRIGR